MIRIGTVRQLALSYEGTIELPHFDRASFRVQNKIFATLIEEKHQAVLMLSVIDQSVFCGYDQAAMYPVPNKWGKKAVQLWI